MDRSPNDPRSELEVHPLDPARVPDFDQIHAEAGACGWCQCVAWWVPSWVGWAERSAEENRALRERLFQDGEYDGYLLYWKGEPVGWMQLGPVGRLQKLWNGYHLDELEVTPRDLAVSCVFLRSSVRRKGWLHVFLEEVIRDLETNPPPGRTPNGQLLAFPRRGQRPAEDVWTGPDAVFAAAGFRVLRDEGDRAVLARPLGAEPVARHSQNAADSISRAVQGDPRLGDAPGDPSKEAATRPSVVVFDLGGVLVDNAGIGRLLDWAPHLSPGELWTRWLASPSVRDFESGRTDPHTFAQSLAEEFSLDADPQAIQRELTSWIRGFFPGVRELLAELRPQARLACLSNTNEAHWGKMIEEIDLYAALHHRFLSFRTGLLKPDTEAFAHLVSALAMHTGGRPERILFLDDHPDNVAAACRHGIDGRRTVGLGAVRAELVLSGFVLKAERI